MNAGSGNPELEATDEEKSRWVELGRTLKEDNLLSRWSNTCFKGRGELLERAHLLMRPSFNLQDSTSTRIVLAKEVETGMRPEGMGFDDQRGEYIVIAFDELDHDDPAVPLSGLAHELRHAYQCQEMGSGSSGPRVAAWTATYKSDCRHAEDGLLELDARQAQCCVLTGHRKAS